MERLTGRSELNQSKIPGLRSEYEFSEEYRALSQLIGNLEERTELIALDKKREQDNKKVDLFDRNKSIRNQILETNRELEKKLTGNLNYMDDLETNLEGLKRNSTKLMGEYKKAMNELATKKTEDLIDNKVRDQITNAKNLFFKKVLREIVVGNEKVEEIIRVLETKIAQKEKLLKKALLAAEHYRVTIEKVENKYQGLKRKDEDFLKRISGALSFGHVRIGDEMNTIEARKLFGRDFRGEKGIRESLGLKDRLVILEMDRLAIYDGVTMGEPVQVIPFSEVKEVNLIKEEVDIKYNIGSADYSDSKKMSSIFYLKYKNDRGGFLIECEASTSQKWDSLFFLVNIIIVNNIPLSLKFSPFTVETNSAKLIKNINIKILDPIVVKKQPPFAYDYPMEDNKKLVEVEDTLIDWVIVEAIAARDNDTLVNKVVKKAKAPVQPVETVSPGKVDPRMGSLEDETGTTQGAGGMLVPTKGPGSYAMQDPRYKIQEYNYTIPSLSSFIKDADLIKIYGEDAVGGDKTVNKNPADTEEPQELPSPQVELDMSFESKSDKEGQLIQNDRSDDKKGSSHLPGEGKKGLGGTGQGGDGKPLELGGEAFGKMADLFSLDKVDLDSMTMERAYRQNVLRSLNRGVAAKGSGMGNNSGKYIVKSTNDFIFIERFNVSAKRKETKKIMAISEISFHYEYKDLRTNQIEGATIIVISFTDKSHWEFKTPRRNKNTFYICLMFFRLNFRDFEILDKTGA